MSQRRISEAGSAAPTRLVEELDAVMASGPAIPMEPGGWWHQYVCPEHHTELLFDELKEDDGRYVCPYGCVLEGEPYHGAWLVFRHQAMARFALQAAAVFAATGERRYGEYGKAIIVAYAKQFPLYPVHPDAQPWMLKGRAFHQALTEAIWATTLIRAYLLLRDKGMDFEEAGSELSTFWEMLETSMEQYHGILTVDRNQPENNYTAWLNAALCCVYAALDDERKVNALLERRGGLRHHLEIAIQADGLEFEGSVYYHVFVLRAYMIAAEMAGRFGYDVYAINGGGRRSMEGMLDVLAAMADEHGRLPATHDGPYSRIPYAREIVEIFEIGYTKYRKPDYWRLLRFYYKELNPEDGRRSGLEYALYGSDTDEALPVEESSGIGAAIAAVGKRASTLLPDSGFALLRHPENPLSALVDFGPHGGSHGHYDKLNVMLDLAGCPLSPDRGTVPYGSVLKKQWYSSTPCHNTVSVNRQSQAESSGRCLSYRSDESGTFISMAVDGAYEGTELIRHVAVTGEYVIDWYQVRMKEEGEIDWWFHFLGELRQDASGWERHAEPVTLGESGGYEYVRGIAGMRPEAYTVTGEWQRADLQIRVVVAGDEAANSAATAFSEGCLPDGGGIVSAALLMPAQAELSLVESPGIATDPSVPMNGIVLRHRGLSADFVAVYRSEADVVGLEWADVSDDHEAAGGESSEVRTLIITTDAGRIAYRLTEDGLKEMDV